MSKIFEQTYEYAYVSDPTSVTTLAPYQTTLETYTFDLAAATANGFGRCDFSVPAGGSMSAALPSIPPGAIVYLYNSMMSAPVQGNSVVLPGLAITNASLTPFVPGATPTRAAQVTLMAANPGQMIRLPGYWFAAQQNSGDVNPTIALTTCIISQAAGSVSIFPQDTQPYSSGPLTGTVFWHY